jgi:hypothetical protein
VTSPFPSPPLVVQRLAATVAIVFGIATLVAGLGTLLEWSDPEYPVFRPLLVFNAVMGGAYAAVGAAAWRSLPWGRNGAGTILLLNLIALGAAVLLHVRAGAVAPESVRAMGFRTAVWLVLFLALVWAHRRPRPGPAA